MLNIKTQNVFDDLKAVIVEIANDFGCDVGMHVSVCVRPQGYQ